MKYRLVAELVADGHEIALACLALGVSRSGFYEWRSRPASERDVAHLGEQIRTIHRESHCSYGAPRVHSELRLGSESGSDASAWPA